MEDSEALVKIWNRIPKTLCQKIIDTFDKRIEQVKDTGERYNRRLEKKEVERPQNQYQRWNHPWNPVDEIENVVFNDKALMSAKKSAIWRIKRLRANSNREYKANIVPLYKKQNIEKRATKSERESI